VERAARVSRLARMEMPMRDILARLPLKMKLMLLHVQRAERERRTAPTVAAAPEAQAPIVIEPIAHRRVS
jgi:hypothetical protein